MCIDAPALGMQCSNDMVFLHHIGLAKMLCMHNVSDFVHDCTHNIQELFLLVFPTECTHLCLVHMTCYMDARMTCGTNHGPTCLMCAVCVCLSYILHKKVSVLDDDASSKHHHHSDAQCAFPCVVS